MGWYLGAQGSYYLLSSCSYQPIRVKMTIGIKQTIPTLGPSVQLVVRIRCWLAPLEVHFGLEVLCKKPTASNIKHSGQYRSLQKSGPKKVKLS